MRKKIIVVMSVLILIFNCIVERPKANAAALGAVAAAGGLSEGALTALGAAAGPYVIAGLIIAAGGAAVYESVQHRQEIAAKAKSIWGSMSDSARDAFNQSLDASLKKGSQTVTLKKGFIDGLVDGSKTISDFIAGQLWSTEAVPDTVYIADGVKLYTHAGDNKWFNGAIDLYDANHKYDILINGDRTNGISLTNTNYPNYFLSLYYFPVVGMRDGDDVNGSPVSFTTNFNVSKLNNPDFTTVSGVMSILSAAGYPISIVPSLSRSAVSPATVKDNVDNTLHSVNDIDLPLDNWLAQAKDAEGHSLPVDDIVAGGTYTGAIDYGVADIPVVKVPGTVDLNNPTMPLDDVFTGVDSGAGAGARTGEGALTDVITGIRDFVGDIAQGIGAITGTLAHPVGDVSKIEWDKLKVSAEGITTAFPFSLPWDIKRAISNITVDGQKPKFDFKIKIAGHVYSTDVSIPAMFDPFVPIIRGFFVLIFIIGLIWATRSLFGGAI